MIVFNVTYYNHCITIAWDDLGFQLFYYSYQCKIRPISWSYLGFGCRKCSITNLSIFKHHFKSTNFSLLTYCCCHKRKLFSFVIMFTAKIILRFKTQTHRCNYFGLSPNSPSHRIWEDSAWVVKSNNEDEDSSFFNWQQLSVTTYII